MRLFSRNCSATSSLKEDSISFLKELLLVLSILRKSLWEKLDTMVDSSLEMEAVVLVVVECISLVFLCDMFPFLLPMFGKVLILSTSYGGRMWCLTACCGRLWNWMVVGVAPFGVLQCNKQGQNQNCGGWSGQIVRFGSQGRWYR